MPDDVFREVRDIEAEAARLLKEAQAAREALAADARTRIAHLEREADQAFQKEVAQARREHEARLAEERHRADEAHETALQHLETIRTRELDALADWLIERPLEADRGD